MPEGGTGRRRWCEEDECKLWSKLDIHKHPPKQDVLDGWKGGQRGSRCAVGCLAHANMPLRVDAEFFAHALAALPDSIHDFRAQSFATAARRLWP